MVKWIVLGLSVVLIVGLLYHFSLQREYNVLMKEVAKEPVNGLITEEDLSHLPKPVIKYLNYVGVVGKPHVNKFNILFNGQMKLNETSEWATIEANQHSILASSKRYFFMKMKVKGLPIVGLHKFNQTDAQMKIKLLDMVKIVDVSGKDLKKAETVTYFNDICLFAPSYLIDADIKWSNEDIDYVTATYTLDGITISADLYFNEKGQLINFISEDRLYLDEHQNLISRTWSTPINSYQNLHGYQLPLEGKAVWLDDQGEFEYIQLHIKDIKY